jgi:hypothetical protein
MSAIMPLPLLHAGPVPLGSSFLDLRTAAIAAAVFAMATASIWWSPVPDRASLMRRGLWLRVGRRAACVMTAAALWPAVLPYDHLLPGAHLDSAAGESVHASHCHVSPGTCSDVPLASGLGEFLFTEPLVLVPAMLSVALLAASVVLWGFVPRPELRPPMLGAAA